MALVAKAVGAITQGSIDPQTGGGVIVILSPTLHGEDPDIADFFNSLNVGLDPSSNPGLQLKFMHSDDGYLAMNCSVPTLMPYGGSCHIVVQPSPFSTLQKSPLIVMYKVQGESANNLYQQLKSTGGNYIFESSDKHTHVTANEEFFEAVFKQ